MRITNKQKQVLELRNLQREYGCEWDRQISSSAPNAEELRVLHENLINVERSLRALGEPCDLNADKRVKAAARVDISLASNVNPPREPSSSVADIDAPLNAQAGAPEPCPPPASPEPEGDVAVDCAELLYRVVEFIRRFVVLKPSQASVMALWVVHTHCMLAAEHTPYLTITSVEKGCGKTQTLEVLTLLVRTPWYTGRTTTAALVRKIDQDHPALLLDESDAAFHGPAEYAEALRGVLNMGHRRGGKVSLCVGQGAEITFKDFDVFCPKAIAGIGKLPDTVADRSIPIELQRKSACEPIERFRRRIVEPEAEQIRKQLKKWATANVSTLKDLWPPLPEELSNRQQDGAEPLLAIADMAGGEWPQRARATLIELFTGTAAEDDSVGVRLLSDIHAIFNTRNVDRLPSADLARALAGIEGAPWAEFQGREKITPTKVAQLLKPYKVYPQSIRVGDNRTPKGYLRDDFADAWSRYLRPAQATASAMSLSDTPQPQQPPQPSIDAGITHIPTPQQGHFVAVSENDKSPMNTPLVAGVADAGSIENTCIDGDSTVN
jgi:hypothetical protein